MNPLIAIGPQHAARPNTVQVPRIEPHLDPARSSFGSWLRLDDLDSFDHACLAAGVLETHGGWQRLHAPKGEDSGLRIGALIDPDCSLLRLIGNL